MVEPGKELSSIDFKNLIGGPLVAVVEAQAQAALSTVNFIREIGFKQPAQNKGDEAEDLPTTGEPIYVVFKYPKEIAPYEPATASSFSINVIDGGLGYVSPKVSITGGGGGKDAAATARIDGEGRITSIEITNAGAGYTSKPSVKITEESSPKPAELKEATLDVVFVSAAPSTPAVFQEMKLEVPMLSIVPIPYLRVDEVTIDFNAKINSMQTYEYTSSYGVDTKTDTKASGGFFFAKASTSFSCSTAYKSSSKSTGQVERTYSLAVHVRAVQDELPGGMERILGILEDAIRSQPVSAPKPVTV